jgi:hypothetical protein
VRLQKKSTVAFEAEFVKILVLNAIPALGKTRLIAVEDTVGDILTEVSKT